MAIKSIKSILKKKIRSFKLKTFVFLGIKRLRLV